MTPKASKHGRATGKSFKGVFAYLGHDKRLEGETHRTTTDRLEWAAFNNLAVDHPDAAWRVMAATARQQDEIKRAAGNSVAGNKSDQVVFHYSLGWHPDEKDGLSQAEMIRAANESLMALGAANHQSAIIAHNDTAHPHVHVVVNRVDLESGKLLDLWNYQKKLSKWAMSYEQSRGQIFCDKRVENWKKRDQGKTVNADKDQSWHEHDQTQALGHVNDNDKAQILADQKAKDADLAAYGQKLHSKHSAEWEVYSADYKDGKAQIFDRKKGRTAFQRARADVQEQFKPLRSQLGRQQWKELKAFEKKEARVSGKLENALAAVRYARVNDPDSSRGFMSMAFNFLVNKKARHDALEQLHRKQWRNLRSAEKGQIDAAIGKLKADQQTALAAFRQKFAPRRQMLKDQQDAERAALQRKWRDRKQERQRVAKLVESSEYVKDQSKAAPEASRGQMRAEFNRAAKGGRRKGRTRKRPRNPK